MRKALITGGNGFLGSFLAKELLKNNIEVIVADMEGYNANVPDGARFVAFDMRNFESLKDSVTDRDIDVMYHMAWVGTCGTCSTLSGDYRLQLDNVKYTCDAVEVAASMGIKRFVGAGTMVQFDRQVYIPEDGSEPNATDYYAAAKISAQYMSKAVAGTEHIEHVWCILANTYGVGNTTENFVNMVSKKWLQGGCMTFTSAEQNYDFVYVTDTVHGLFLCGENGKNACSYYIGSGKARQLKEYICIIRDTVDPKIPLYLGEIPFKGVSAPIEKYDCSKTMKDTGYRAEISFEEGIKKTVEWLKENGGTKI